MARRSIPPYEFGVDQPQLGGEPRPAGTPADPSPEPTGHKSDG